MEFRIDPDITKAQTLPSRAYADPAVFEAEKGAIFARSWQFVTDTERVKVPGQVYPFTLLEGCLDEPLMFTRDSDDVIHCLSNVCTHRGNIVVEGEGVCNSLSCRYHGRRFGLNGKFRFMPEFDKTEGFPSEADDLPRVPFGRWHNLLFVTGDPMCTLEEFVAPMEERIGWMPIGDFAFDAGRSKDYLVRANWALYCDNYLEGFHIPFIHAGLTSQLDYSNYRDILFTHATLQLGVGKGGDDVFDLPSGHPDEGQPIAAFYFWLYPNMMFNFYPWGLSINVVRPLAVDLTKVSFLSYVWDAAKMDRGAGAALDRVEREDEAVVEMVQRGVRSRYYDRGRYSPTREQGVHHFHSMLARDLSR